MAVNARLDQWLGKGTYLVQCISSSRATDRRKRFDAFTQEIGLSFAYWDAIDEDTLTPTDREMANVHVQGTVSDRTTAQRLSMHQCMDAFLESTDKEFLWILHDDAGFPGNDDRTSTTTTTMSEPMAPQKMLDALLSFLDACSLRAPSCTSRTHPLPPESNMDYEWMQVWFGYDDESHIQRIGDHDSVICRCTGASSTHAMLFRREAVQLLVHGLVRWDARHVPIDWFLKNSMKEALTLVPRYTIIGRAE